MLGLAPWRRGGRLLWRFPAVWGALVAVGGVFALTLTVPLLYLGSTASASFAKQAAGRCQWTAGLQAIGTVPVPGSFDAIKTYPASLVATRVLGSAADAAQQADGGRGLGPAVTTLLTGGTIGGLPGKDDEPTRVLYRDTGEQHVRLTSRVPGDGLLLTDRVAAALRVRAGGTVRFLAQAGPGPVMRVVGTYQDLADTPMQPFWCSLDPVIHLQDPFSNDVPPPVALATSPQQAIKVLHGQSPDADMQVRVERPLGAGLRIDEGDQALVVVQAAQLRARRGERPDDRYRLALATQLPFLVARGHAVQDALTPPIAALAAGAALATLGLVAVTGSFWAERRRTELELLSVRGVGPVALAGKGALECAVPLLIGTLAGTALAVALVITLGPAKALTPGSVELAVLSAPVGWLLAVGVLAAAVRWRLRTAPKLSRRHVGQLPLALFDGLLLAAAIVALRRVSPLQTASDAVFLPSFGLARLILPLLVLLLVARLVVRIGVAMLGAVRGRGDSWPVPVLLAVQRLAAVPRSPAALAVAVAVATGTCLYATGLAGGLERTVQAKAEVFVGGDGSIELVERQRLPEVPGLDRISPVLQLATARLRGSDAVDVDVLAIDPATFRRGAAWASAYADASLGDLLRALSAPSTASDVPAVAIGGLPDEPTVLVPQTAAPLRLALRVVARARAFPGLRQRPLLVVSLPVLEAAHPTATDGATERLWVRGPLQPLVSRLRTAGLAIRSTLDVATVSTAPSLEAVLETLTILRALGLLVAILAAVGLVVYVDVRAQRRRLASVLTTRMGLRRRTDWVSGWLEMGGVAGLGLVVGVVTGLALVRYVTSLLDPLPDIPPGPLVVLPWTFVTALVVATLAVTALAATVSLRRSDTDAAVLRVE